MMNLQGSNNRKVIRIYDINCCERNRYTTDYCTVNTSSGMSPITTYRDNGRHNKSNCPKDELWRRCTTQLRQQQKVAKSALISHQYRRRNYCSNNSNSSSSSGSGNSCCRNGGDGSGIGICSCSNSSSVLDGALFSALVSKAVGSKFGGRPGL